jgi:hypothetical protein
MRPPGFISLRAIGEGTMIHRRSFIRGVIATVATVVAAAGAPKVAAAIEVKGIPKKNGLYTGVRYQFWTPLEPNNHTMFVQRFESREATDFKIVGASLHGGPISFLSDKEAHAHLSAIEDAHLVECERVLSSHAEGAEKSIAIYKKMGLSHDANLIRAHHKAAAERQVASYKENVRDYIKTRSGMIGPSHPTLALELHKQVSAALAEV